MTLKEEDSPVPMTVGGLAQIKREVATRCAEIASERPHRKGYTIADKIRREFGLLMPESDSTEMGSRELDAQIEKWRHLTATDESGDRLHHLGCGSGSPCPAEGYLGDDWLIAQLLSATPSTPKSSSTEGE